MEEIRAEDEVEREAVCRAIAEEFGLSESSVAEAVYLAEEWPGEVQEGAVLLVQTGRALPAGDIEEVVQSWLTINDCLEEQGVDLYSEVKTPIITAFYRFS